MLASRNLRSVNITDEALTEAVVRTAVALAVVAVPVTAAVDSTLAADFSVARVLVAGCQPHHGKGKVVRLEVWVDQVPDRRAILPTSEGAAPARIGPDYRIGSEVVPPNAIYLLGKSAEIVGILLQLESAPD